MYGLKPGDIEHLSQLRGTEIIQVCVGQYDLQFSCHSSSGVSITGRCELYDDNGQLVDVWENGERSERFRFLELLGQTVSEVNIDTEKSFKLTFANGVVLRVIDNSDQFESFSVGNLFV